MFSNIKTWLLIGAIGVAFVSGIIVRDAFCDAAAAKKEVVGLTKQIDALRLDVQARDEAISRDAQRAREDQKEIIRLEGATNELLDKISAGACFDESDTRWLRQLWQRR